MYSILIFEFLAFNFLTKGIVSKQNGQSGSTTIDKVFSELRAIVDLVLRPKLKTSPS
jgi:hypothetical protein